MVLNRPPVMDDPFSILHLTDEFDRSDTVSSAMRQTTHHIQHDDHVCQKPIRVQDLNTLMPLGPSTYTCFVWGPDHSRNCSLGGRPHIIQGYAKNDHQFGDTPIDHFRRGHAEPWWDPAPCGLRLYDVLWREHELSQVLRRTASFGWWWWDEPTRVLN